MKKQKLLVSFSGGKTSGMMSFKILENVLNQADDWNYELQFAFANTSCEHEETLIFVDKCDKEFGLNVTWLEAVIQHQKRVSTTHKITNFEYAMRKGEIFEDMIRKYGIPNKVFSHCTRELKIRPIDSWLKSIGWKDALRAIGIRADEPKRLAEKKGFIYPMATMGLDKQDVNDFWEDQSFNLKLEEHQGNCTFCFKKSKKKHFRLIDENPEFYDFPRRMEAKYGFHGAGDKEEGGRVFFRSKQSTNQLFNDKKEFYNPRLPLFNDEDEDGGCSESCEAY